MGWFMLLPIAYTLSSLLLLAALLKEDPKLWRHMFLLVALNAILTGIVYSSQQP